MEHFTEAGSTLRSILHSSHKPDWCWFIFWRCPLASSTYLPGFGTNYFLLSHQMPGEAYFIQTDSLLLFFIAHFQDSFLLVNASLRACCCCAFLNTYPNVISIISKLSDSLGIA